MVELCVSQHAKGPHCMPKVGFVSLGCPKNLVDSEVMMGILARAGYELTPRAGEADVLVVNTCSFIEPAQKESVDSILEMAEYKKFGKAQKLIVAGCMVERYRNDIRQQIPEVDAVIGTGEVEKILEACEGQLRADVDVDGARAAALPDYLYNDATPRILATSQDTTYYGEDLGIRDGLATLLERLAQIEDLNWVRFLYCYPNRITPKLLDTIAAHPRLAKYIDVPLQHASRNVLARMKRGGNGDAFLKMLEKARKAIPGVSLRTSFIVGFPGETEKDFEELCDFVRAAHFDWLGVFSYSDEDTSKSFALDGKVDAKTIAPRRDTLMSIQKKISAANLWKKVGQTMQVMLDGPSKDTDLIWEARLQGMAPEIDGKVYVTEFAGVDDAAELPAAGTTATIEITEAKDYDLIGRVTEFRKPRRECKAAVCAFTVSDPHVNSVGLVGLPQQKPFVLVLAKL